jgi:alanine racemase
VHLKVNTGLNRVGVATAGALGLVGHAVGAGLDVRGVWTHFAVADDVDHPATALQLARLRDAVRDITAAGHPTGLLHAANTAAILAHPGAHLDLVRAGIGIYGLSPDAALPGAGDLVPVLSWRTTVTYVKRVEAGEGVSYGFTARTARPATVATIPVGFADGYPRCLSNRGEALIRGTRFPILGTIAMDQMLVDCGDDVVDVGDEVVLIGRQGSHVVTAEELAGLAGTIVDEILCGISTRVPRRYSS